MGSTCQLPGEYLPDVLCTAFVLGLRDENIARKLLSEKDPTLDKAISIAQKLQDLERKQMKSQFKLLILWVLLRHL